MLKKPSFEEFEKRAREHDKIEAVTNLAEEDLTIKIKEWQAAFDAINDAVWILSHDQCVLYANRTSEKFFQLPVSEIIGKYCYKILHCKMNSIKECLSLKSQNSNTREKKELQIGNEWFEVTVDPILNVNDHYIGSTHIARSITEGKKAEETLRKSENKYHMLFEKMLNGCSLHEVIYDENGKPFDYRFLDVNPAFVKLTRNKASNILGKTALEVRPEADPYLIEKYIKVALTGEPISFDFYNPRTGNQFIITAYQPEKGQFACIFQNVTELKQAENALRESEEKFRILVENQIVGLFISQDKKLIYVNDRFAEMHGYTNDEIIGQPFDILIHPDERKTLKSRMHERLTVGENVKQRFEMLRIKKNGETFWGGAIVTGGQYHGKHAVMGSLIDISESKQAEEELKTAHEGLEIRVQERTEELQKANDDLNEKTKSLEDVNIALKILLDKREQDKEENGEKILLNVKEFLIPYVDKLKNGPLTESQRNYIGLLESGLQEIISPFAQKLTSRYMHITPREMQVANLVKEGKTSKEIAEILYTTERTVVAHRSNLRKKLGLKQKSNLRTYLLSLK